MFPEGPCHATLMQPAKEEEPVIERAGDLGKVRKEKTGSPDWKPREKGKLMTDPPQPHLCLGGRVLPKTQMRQ